MIVAALKRFDQGQGAPDDSVTGLAFKHLPNCLQGVVCLGSVNRLDLDHLTVIMEGEVDFELAANLLECLFCIDVQEVQFGESVARHRQDDEQLVTVSERTRKRGMLSGKTDLDVVLRGWFGHRGSIAKGRNREACAPSSYTSPCSFTCVESHLASVNSDTVTGGFYLTNLVKAKMAMAMSETKPETKRIGTVPKGRGSGLCLVGGWKGIKDSTQ